MSRLMNEPPFVGVEGNSYLHSTPRGDVTAVMGLSKVFQEVCDGSSTPRHRPCGNCGWCRLAAP